MSEQEKHMAEQLFAKQQPPSVLEAAREAVQGLFPGLSVDKFVKDMGHELTQQLPAGAHEIAAALFNQSAFVMYPRGSREDHGVHGPEKGQDERGFAEELQQERQQERGGREM